MYFFFSCGSVVKNDLPAGEKAAGRFRLGLRRRCGCCSSDPATQVCPSTEGTESLGDNQRDAYSCYLHTLRHVTLSPADSNRPASGPLCCSLGHFSSHICPWRTRIHGLEPPLVTVSADSFPPLASRQQIPSACHIRHIID
jgi:hypothetical protein